MKYTCKVCHSENIKVFYQRSDVPAFQNKLFSDLQDALDEPRLHVDLNQCLDCDFIFNLSFESRVMDYDEGYQNAQDSSGKFKVHLSSIAERIFSATDEDDCIVEVGCGKGYFLDLLKKKRPNVLGFDPAYEGKSPFIRKEYFGTKSNIYKDVDAIIMRHVLEHIESPVEFLLNLKNRYKGSRVFIEVPRMEWIIDNRAFWDIFHEHCNYFTEQFFYNIFGGKVSIQKVFGEQYMLIEAELKNLMPIDGSLTSVSVCEDVFSSEVEKYQLLLKSYNSNYVWGGGAKGVAFVNAVDPQQESVVNVIDINPKKNDLYVPVSGHKCIPPNGIDWASLSKDDCLWIMNAEYVQEIINSLPSLGCDIQVLASNNITGYTECT